MSEVRERPGAPPMCPAEPGASDLVRGMLLLRASNMNVMRLQLAAERQDRQSAMAAMDELFGIDRELDQFITTMAGPLPAEENRRDMFERQRRLLASERMVLARGKLGPAIAPEAPSPGPGPLPECEPSPPESLPSCDAPDELAAASAWPRILIALGVGLTFACILFVLLAGAMPWA